MEFSTPTSERAGRRRTGSSLKKSAMKKTDPDSFDTPPSLPIAAKTSTKKKAKQQDTMTTPAAALSATPGSQSPPIARRTRAGSREPTMESSLISTPKAKRMLATPAGEGTPRRSLRLASQEPEPVAVALSMTTPRMTVIAEAKEEELVAPPMASLQEMVTPQQNEEEEEEPIDFKTSVEVIEEAPSVRPMVEEIAFAHEPMEEEEEESSLAEEAKAPVAQPSTTKKAKAPVSAVEMRRKGSKNKKEIDGSQVETVAMQGSFSNERNGETAAEKPLSRREKQKLKKEQRLAAVMPKPTKEEAVKQPTKITFSAEESVATKVPDYDPIETPAGWTATDDVAAEEEEEEEDVDSPPMEVSNKAARATALSRQQQQEAARYMSSLFFSNWIKAWVLKESQKNRLETLRRERRKKHQETMATQQKVKKTVPAKKQQKEAPQEKVQPVDPKQPLSAALLAAYASRTSEKKATHIRSFPDVAKRARDSENQPHNHAKKTRTEGFEDRLLQKKKKAAKGLLQPEAKAKLMLPTHGSFKFDRTLYMPNKPGMDQGKNKKMNKKMKKHTTPEPLRQKVKGGFAA